MAEGRERLELRGVAGQAHSRERPAPRDLAQREGPGGHSPWTHTLALGEHAQVIPVELQLGPQQVLQLL